MRIFPRLAARTNLNEDELKVYYSIRFTYIHPYSERNPQHEQSLLSLAMTMLRAGKIKFETTTDAESSAGEESKFGQSFV